MTSIYRPTNQTTTPYVFHFGSQEPGSAGFDYSVAMAIGRKFGLSSYPLTYFRRGRGPGDPEATPTTVGSGTNTGAIAGGKLSLTSDRQEPS